MNGQTADTLVRTWRRRALATWIVLGGVVMLALAAMFVMAATDPGENIALSRNEVVRSADGKRMWRGTFWNHSDSLYTDLDTVVLFLDPNGHPVAQVAGGAERLDPGEVFHLATPLPANAARMQVYRMAWTTGGGDASAVLGPFRPWQFGYVTDAACDDLRLKTGSCTPQREIG